jgi:hypothetical protein
MLATGTWLALYAVLCCAVCCSEEVAALTKAVQEHGMALVVFAEW